MSPTSLDISQFDRAATLAAAVLPDRHLGDDACDAYARRRAFGGRRSTPDLSIAMAKSGPSAGVAAETVSVASAILESPSRALCTSESGG